MIDPVHSLVFSIHANPGVYAVLLGSGVSSAAKIPTGWDVTLDLVRKLATIFSEECDPAPDHWYLDKFGKEANYSDLLDELAKTPAERQQLLRHYWEPTDRDRDEGYKTPTAAHKSIASLAAKGFIRVIVTTNFDRLIETALTDEGIVPTVISSSDHIQGALPLIHTECCVFKVHGDYLDTRILNTLGELDHYPEAVDHLLDRIFDEFGLVVCGWSAEWDGALRKALYRARSRRFTTYWTTRGQVGDEAQRLIDHRRAQVISIKDADVFFQTIQRSVESLEEFAKPHPLSIESAIASLKRYMSEPRYRIQLSDLIDNIVASIVDIISGEVFSVQGGPEPNRESVTARVRNYDATCTTLMAMATVGGYWAEEEHHTVWKRALDRLATRPHHSGTPLWLDLQLYPATILLYALGLGAVEADRLQFLKRIMESKIRQSQGDVAAIKVLPPFCQFGSYPRGAQVMQILEDMDRHHTPLNDWIHKTLRPHCKRIIPEDDRYALVFDKLETLMAIRYYKEERWLLPGRYLWRNVNRERILGEIKESIAILENKSPWVTCGIIGDDLQDCKNTVMSVEELIRKQRWR